MPEAEEDVSLPFSEDGIALELANQNLDRIRYVDPWKSWFIYDGMRWRRDDRRTAYSFSRVVCRAEAGKVNSEPRRHALASARTRSAVLSLASDDQRLAASVDQWDADLLSLNTPAGTVDLRTGKLRLHEPADYNTKITAVGPAEGCPLWMTFLHRITGKDEDLKAFLQRIAGYALTGLTTEHALFFLHGFGANGKSVFLNTLAGVMGEYHQLAAVETFTSVTGDRHPTELAMLQGARLVTAIETEEGRSWAESKIKSLTGGDPITARYMRQDFFKYQPQFKLFIAGNHKPGLKTVDEAIRRRIRLVPFNETIPAAERDPNLAQALRQEWPGILAWAIEGCREWLERGLDPPRAVLAATDDYLHAEDAIMRWKDDECQDDPNSFTPVGELFGSWKAWAGQNGEPVGSQKSFSQSLQSKGYKPHRGSARGFNGLHLKKPERM